ncbi:MAG TPA: helix-turn-helix domain-containing protein [Chloroflexota bacterium]|nr:helix-turn-helix domain-containing protein [Chloroflexota bacterium]
MATRLAPPMTPVATIPERMTAKQVAAYLGMNVFTVYTEREAGRLPAVAHGSRSWRWKRETILAYDRPQVTGTPETLRDIVRRELSVGFRYLAEHIDQALARDGQLDTGDVPASAPAPRYDGRRRSA